MTESVGIEATLTRKGAGFYSDPPWRYLGESLRSALASKRGESEIHGGLWLLSTIPLTEEILRAFSNLKIEMLDETFVRLQFSSSRAAWVFNPLNDLLAPVKAAILDFLLRPRAQREFISRILPTRIPRNMDPLAFLGNAFEAAALDYFEPIIVQSAAGFEDIGQPFLIDLDLSQPDGWISKKTPRRPNVSANYPGFFRLLNAFKAENPTTRNEVRTVLSDLKKRPDTAPVTDGDRAATKVFFGYYEEEIPGEERLQSSSHRRYIQEIPYLISVLKRDVPYPEILRSYQVAALGILEKWSDFGSKIKLLIASTRRSESATLQNLVGLTAARKWFGIDSLYPEIEDVRRCATKIILIVLYAGRRVRCLADVRPKDFRVNSEGRIDLWIESTKVKKGGKKWFPLSGILPDDDLNFILRWLESLAGNRPLCGVCGLENRSLIAIAAGISDEQLFEKRNFHGTVSAVLKTYLNRKESMNTHDPRRIFANWFPIRCMIEEEPALLEYPFIKQNIPAEYLSEAARSRLSELVAAKEFDDPIIAATALMGNLSTKQLRQTYCRMWAIWMKLRSELIQEAL